MKPDVPRFVQRIGKLRHIPHAEGLVQRAWDFSGHLALPNLSNSVHVGRLRHIQSKYETPECRNPDPLIHDLLPAPLRWLSTLQAKTQLSKLHKNPFYYYLIARTRYYDQVFNDAIDSNLGCIVNIGCGTDTRAYRFAEQLKFRGIKVVECDQAAFITIKQQLARRIWQTDHVTYVSVDLNDPGWPDLEHCLDAIPRAVLVMLEGVSPYINGVSFDRFLKLLVVKLHSGSVVAYDYKIQGIDVSDSNGNLFRLPATKHDVIAYHDTLGYRVQRLELSWELSSRLLRNFATSHTCSFAQDGLLKLTIPARTN
jgi:methyltransferase (TIGR00027 family)